MLQRFVFLLVLLSTTNQAFETCDVLFVIDGSSYWSSFRNELTSVSTVANLLYSSSAMYFNANFWLYGNGDQDQPIPTYFYGSKNDFLNSVGELKSSQGPETIVGATSKLNRWPVYEALIVIYLASPQNLIDIAGYNYTEQARTVTIHQNDGVDTNPISDYPSPQVSEYPGIVELITNACKHIPTRPPMETTTTEQMNPTTELMNPTTEQMNPTSTQQALSTSTSAPTTVIETVQTTEGPTEGPTEAITTEGPTEAITTEGPSSSTIGATESIGPTISVGYTTGMTESTTFEYTAATASPSPTFIMSTFSTEMFSTSSPPNGPVSCLAFFYIDVSTYAENHVASQIFHAGGVANALANSPEVVPQFAVSYYGSDQEMSLNFGDQIHLNDQLNQIYDVVAKGTRRQEAISKALTRMNHDLNSKIVTVFYTNSPQGYITAAQGTNQFYQSTVGMSISGQDMTPVAVVNGKDMNDYLAVAQNVISMCMNAR